MEIVQRRNRSAVPVLFVLAFVAALVIGLVALSGLRQSPESSTGTVQVAAQSSSLSPDATDRNAAMLATRLGKAESTHGH